MSTMDDPFALRYALPPDPVPEETPGTALKKLLYVMRQALRSISEDELQVLSFEIDDELRRRVARMEERDLSVSELLIPSIEPHFLRSGLPARLSKVWGGNPVSCLHECPIPELVPTVGTVWSCAYCGMVWNAADTEWTNPVQDEHRREMEEWRMKVKAEKRSMEHEG